MTCISLPFRLFVASPSDVSFERDALARVVEEVNQTHGAPLGYSINLLWWETHVTPSGGRPQGVVNELIPTYDIFVGIMWRRFGTPTGLAGSGTEEEYQIAYRRWQSNSAMPLMFYFCQKPFMPRRVDEVEQMKNVLEFRSKVERMALVWKYSSPEIFENDIRKHLCLRMSRLLQEQNQRGTQKARPHQESIDDLRSLWDRMTPDLQKAFSVAYNENRRAGDPGIQTRDLFAAMLRVAGEQLRPIVSEIPQTALPRAVQGPVAEQPYVLEERPWLSHCIASSISRLRKALPTGRDLTAIDVFADIAKNGSGESVALLRKHQIGPKEIDEILVEKGLDVVKV
jgi:hypothetical protein